ncbi:MAG: dihydropteroate synthase [Planctomycetes bacterium]|nr:dihydropteroate synthase [Planctomycetota bacterium]
MPREHFHFVTGRLANHSLAEIVPPLAEKVGFDYSIDVLPITVAALMTPAWIAKHIRIPNEATKLLIPGYCEGPLHPLQSVTQLPIERGPRDLRQLPQYFSRPPLPNDYGTYDVEILAEINHCPRLSLPEILSIARKFREDGADIIDLGCEPGEPWQQVADTVQALRDEGHRVSIDSLNPREIQPAVEAGAELVLSVNSSNREAAPDWGTPVVAIPDDPKSLAGLDDTIDFLARAEVPLRIDPILEPISFGFAESLGRYLEVRRRYPDAEMMMGIGNLTELTDADSAGINTLLLGFCQETAIRSILTTQVINWARTSVRECDLARRLMYHAVNCQVLPKHLEPKLVMLRDEQIVASDAEHIATLAADIRDNNYRIFATNGEIHLISRNLHLHNVDPMAIMDELSRSGPSGGLPEGLDASHTFYLGYEMCKAKTALTLGKTYEQDESLDWGLATQHENRHYLKRKPRGDLS